MSKKGVPISSFFAPKVEQTVKLSGDSWNDSQENQKLNRIEQDNNPHHVDYSKKLNSDKIQALHDSNKEKEKGAQIKRKREEKRSSFSGSKGTSSIGGVPFDSSSGNSKGKTDDGDVEAISEDAVISLSESQMKVLKAILARKSVFFTGAAGTGKSYILRVLQDVMNHLGLAEKIAFTAPTGVAACNVRGLTIHSWSGIGLGLDPAEKICATIKGKREVKMRWEKTEILVIDEISMLSAEMFDLLSEVGRVIRNDERPFGGMQIVLCGDFFQLPPVYLHINVLCMHV
jgi:ATP-dependent DNA helicase PIF1